MKKSIYILITFLLTQLSSIAQVGVDTMEKVEPSINQLPETGKGLLYQDGKIYLVVLVLLTIFAGIVFYLIRLDKKITNIEHKIN
jgi:CcmD family protein